MKKMKALLVLDMIYPYIYGSEPLIPLENRNKLISNIKKAINLARNNNVYVIYINSAFRKSDPIFKNYINYREQAMEETKNYKIINELKPQTYDFILKKRGYGGFWKSGLRALLKKLEINEIFLTGCQTDCCVRETAVTAAHLGYDVYVIEDCCETNREFGQVAAIRFMKNCTRDIIETKNLQDYF